MALDRGLVLALIVSLALIVALAPIAAPDLAVVLARIVVEAPWPTRSFPRTHAS